MSSALRPLFFLSCTWLVGLLAACGGDDESHVPTGTGDGFSNNPSVNTQSNSCATPEEGCECADTGTKIDCGNVIHHIGSYTYCSPGTRECQQDGKWGACKSDEVAATDTPPYQPK